MIQLNIRLYSTGMLEGKAASNILHVMMPIAIGALPGEKNSGKPSIAITFDLPDGRTTIIEASMALFHLAAKPFATR
jgi:hypothetical protein